MSTSSVVTSPFPHLISLSLSHMLVHTSVSMWTRVVNHSQLNLGFLFPPSCPIFVLQVPTVMVHFSLVLPLPSTCVVLLLWSFFTLFVLPSPGLVRLCFLCGSLVFRLASYSMVFRPFLHLDHCGSLCHMIRSYLQALYNERPP